MGSNTQNIDTPAVAVAVAVAVAHARILILTPMMLYVLVSTISRSRYKLI